MAEESTVLSDLLKKDLAVLEENPKQTKTIPLFSTKACIPHRCEEKGATRVLVFFDHHWSQNALFAVFSVRSRITILHFDIVGKERSLETLSLSGSANFLIQKADPYHCKHIIVSNMTAEDAVVALLQRQKWSAFVFEQKGTRNAVAFWRRALENGLLAFPQNIGTDQHLRFHQQINSLAITERKWGFSVRHELPQLPEWMWMFYAVASYCITEQMRLLHLP